MNKVVINMNAIIKQNHPKAGIAKNTTPAISIIKAAKTKYSIYRVT